jgi:hypothetical protein
MNKLKFIKPDFNVEWDEATRYPEFQEIGRDGWLRIANMGYIKTYDEIKGVLGNVDLNFGGLEEPKKERFKQAFNNKQIETPIAVKFSNNDYDLVAGNTRVSGLASNGITNFPIWVVDISNDMINEDKLKGGLADKMSKKDIADKFDVSLQKIDKEIRMGIKVEMEHVDSKSKAREIAMDHLVEVPDYYTRLKKMEKDAKKKWKVNESSISNIKRLIREHVDLSVTDETPEETTYNIIYKERLAGIITVTNGPELLEDAIEIVAIKLNEAHEPLSYQIISETLLTLWQATDKNQIVIMPTAKSKVFWEKMGATRLNDRYYIMMRGH